MKHRKLLRRIVRRTCGFSVAGAVSERWERGQMLLQGPNQQWSLDFVSDNGTERTSLAILRYAMRLLRNADASRTSLRVERR